MAKTVKFAVRSHLIVIGTGLSGLVTGALLAKAGRKVVVLSDDTGPDGVPSDDLPFLPQMLSIGFEREGPVDRIFNELGISISLFRRTEELFRKTPSFLQIVFPDFRFALYHEPNENLENLKAGFGAKTPSIRAIFDKMDYWNPLLYPFIYSSQFPVLHKVKWFRQLTSWMVYQIKVFKLKMQKASEFCKETGLDQDGIDYFNALSIFQTGQPLHQLSTLEFLQILIFLKNEPLIVVKGLSGLRELFLKIIKENKGEILSLNPFSLYFQRNRIEGIAFQGRDGIGCDTLIWNPRKGGLQREEGINVCQFYFFVDEKVIPSSMGNFLILKRNPELPFDKFNFLYLSLSEKAAESKSGPKSSSKRGLLVQCLVDSRRVSEDEKILAKEIEGRLIWLIPFAENRLEFTGSKVSKPDIRIPSYFPQEVIRKVSGLQNSPYPVVTLGKSFYYFPHPESDFLISPFLIKRGYDVANAIKTVN